MDEYTPKLTADIIEHDYGMITLYVRNAAGKCVYAGGDYEENLTTLSWDIIRLLKGVDAADWEGHDEVAAQAWRDEQVLQRCLQRRCAGVEDGRLVVNDDMPMSVALWETLERVEAWTAKPH